MGHNCTRRLSTAELISMMSNGALAAPRLHIDAMQWWTEALHGVGLSPGVHFAVDTPAGARIYF